MPTYEFRCPDGHTFERFYRSISGAESEVACPECGKLATRQMSAGAGLLFKGSGFYLTDYGKNAHRTSGPDTSKKTESSGGTESASSESKPAETKPAEPASKNAKASDAKPASPASGSSSKPEK
jgi:putative FmdB family regulatory protein